VGLEGFAKSVRNNIEQHLTNVVAIKCVVGPGVAEPDY
jgi:hypothetical protein